MSNNYEAYEVRVYESGNKYWYLNGKLHRLDGPACEYSNGTKKWYQMGKLHRLDGPAVERADGTKAWYIKGKYYSEQEFNKKIAELNNPTCNGKLVEIEGKKYRLQLVED